MAIDGIPADLVARTAICSVFEESGRKSELDRESAALESDLLAGRWPLDRPAWELTAGKVEQWTGRGLSVGAERKQALYEALVVETALLGLSWNAAQQNSDLAPAAQTLARQVLAQITGSTEP